MRDRCYALCVQNAGVYQLNLLLNYNQWLLVFDSYFSDKFMNLI